MIQKFFSFILALLVTFLLISIPQAQAAPNFITDYRVTYHALENELTRAAMTVTLTNTTTQFYASSYQMQLGFTDITNLTAADPEGPLKPKITKTEEGHLIDLTFNKKAVGQGDKLTFTLTFDTKEVAKKHGGIWEINVPGLANPEEFQSFTVEVKVPPSFGKPTYIKPSQSQQSLVFTKNQLGKSGISIAFGESQLYAFDVDYHIKNKNLFPVTTEVALPPSTNYQDIYITSIEPQPRNVRVDKDGNWMAEYKLLPAQKLDINVRGNAAVRLEPKQQELSLEDYAVYTQEQTYWETSNPEIQRLAAELKTPKAIYEYVVDTLKYDFNRVTQHTARLGAAAAVISPNTAVCREFTDLFIAISRAAGIPAREVNGFAYTQNPRQRPIAVSQDILHAWPEYYDKDKKTWVMIDPTWGSTTGGVDYFSTLDNDHVAFVKKGLDSEEPLPAGAYKVESGSGQKDVRIGFAEAVDHTEPDVSFTPVFPELAFSGLPITGSVVVKNAGSSLVPSQLFTVNSDKLSPSVQQLQFPSIPPFGSATIPVKFHATSLLTNQDAGLTIRYTPLTANSAAKAVLGAQDTSTAAQTIKVAPFFSTVWGIGVGIAVFTLIIFIIAAKSGRIPVFRQKR